MAASFNVDITNTDSSILEAMRVRVFEKGEESAKCSKTNGYFSNPCGECVGESLKRKEMAIIHPLKAHIQNGKQTLRQSFGEHRLGMPNIVL